MKHVVIFSSILLFFGCGQPSVESSSEIAREPIKTNYSLSIKEQFQPLVQQYLDLSDLLVKADSTQAKKYYSELINTVEHINLSELGESPDRMTIELALARISAVLVSFTTVTDISVQRKGFSSLSNELLVLVKLVGLKKQQLQLAFCPMAINGKGAYWLTASNEVINPYYGEEMLHCGELKAIYEFE